MMSGKQAASWEVMRSWGRRLWKAAPSKPEGWRETRGRDEETYREYRVRMGERQKERKKESERQS